MSIVQANAAWLAWPPVGLEGCHRFSVDTHPSVLASHPTTLPTVVNCQHAFAARLLSRSLRVPPACGRCAFELDPRSFAATVLRLCCRPSRAARCVAATRFIVIALVLRNRGPLMNHPRRSLGDPRGAAERMSLFSVFAVNLLLPATLLSAAAHMLSSARFFLSGGEERAPPPPRRPRPYALRQKPLVGRPPDE